MADGSQILGSLPAQFATEANVRVAFERREADRATQRVAREIDKITGATQKFEAYLASVRDVTKNLSVKDIEKQAVKAFQTSVKAKADFAAVSTEVTLKPALKEQYLASIEALDDISKKLDVEILERLLASAGHRKTVPSKPVAPLHIKQEPRSFSGYGLA